MREIKFRARDIETGIWYYWSIGQGNADEFWDSELLQDYCEYTGLKDKNGKEIYEDDIIELIYKTILAGIETTRKEITRVAWGSYMDGEYVENVQCWMVKGDSLSELLTYHPSYGHQKVIDSKVIGNIYENKELLNNV